MLLLGHAPSLGGAYPEDASVRPASAADLDAVASISASAPGAAGWTRGQFEEELGRERALFLVALGDGAVCGYAVAWIVEGWAQILDLAVSVRLRRRGAGRSLLAELLRRARARGAAAAELEVRAGNESALAFYRAAGFRVVGRRPKFYNDGADAVLMDLRLS